MNQWSNEIQAIKKRNEARFIDLQTYETKCLLENGNTLKWYQENDIKKGLSAIADINALMAVIEDLQSQIFNQPKRPEVLALWKDTEKELEEMKQKYIQVAFERFKSRQDVVNIMNSNDDFRNRIIDNIEKGISEYLPKAESMAVSSFEFRQEWHDLLNKMTSAVNLYRKLKYDK